MDEDRWRKGVGVYLRQFREEVNMCARNGGSAAFIRRLLSQLLGQAWVACECVEERPAALQPEEIRMSRCLQFGLTR